METTKLISGLGDRVRVQRIKRSLTQERLAELAGLSPRTVQRIEAGDEASAETIRLLATALDVPVETLRQPRTRRHFNAPWGTAVRWVSGIVAASAIVAQLFLPPIAALPLLGILLACLPFQIAGYSVRDRHLLIHRLGWATKIDLSGLLRVEVNPQAMLGSIRVFGNGGLFGISGYYRNGVIGRYRAFGTDPSRAVVLEFAERKLVVTPDVPAEFEASVLEAVAGTEGADLIGSPDGHR